MADDENHDWKPTPASGARKQLAAEEAEEARAAEQALLTGEGV